MAQLYTLPTSPNTPVTPENDKPAAVATGGDGPHDSDMNERLGRIEGNLEAQRIVKPMTLAVITVLFAAVIGAITFLGVQLARMDSRLEASSAKADSRIESLSAKLDAIPQKLSEEFRAMRAEMAAQTSAIANAVTAAKQQPPQVILIPAPEQPKKD
jgi:hypothetical protein